MEDTPEVTAARKAVQEAQAGLADVTIKYHRKIADAQQVLADAMRRSKSQQPLDLEAYHD